LVIQAARAKGAEMKKFVTRGLLESYMKVKTGFGNSDCVADFIARLFGRLMNEI
jgi:hypothetical protein